MVPTRITEQEIREVFETHGMITDLTILRHPSGDSKGFGLLFARLRVVVLSFVVVRA